jgi:hypothetical protein
MLALSGAIASSSRTLGGFVACGLLLLVALPASGEPTAAMRSGPASFTIEADIHAAPSRFDEDTRCSGPPARLVPGVSRCLVYRVQNRLDAPITVQDLAVAVDPDYPPPSGCSAETLSLPTFSGPLAVPARGSVTAPGLRIQLRDTRTNQDNCKQTVLHFVFAGTAVFASGGTHQLPATGASLSEREMVWAVLLGCALVSLGFVVLADDRRRGRRRGEF